MFGDVGTVEMSERSLEEPMVGELLDMLLFS